MFAGSEYVVAAVIAALLFVFVIATNRNCRRRRPSRTAGAGKQARSYPR